VSRSKANADPFKRRTTRHRGITYRLRADGGKTYSAYHGGRYWPVEGGEREAIVKQAELRAAGKTPTAPTKRTFADAAEAWLASKRKLRPWTRMSYRDALDRILIPRFGTMRLTAITPEHIAMLIRELEGKGLSSSTIENYLLPLGGTMALAAKDQLIPVNPCSLLTSDDRPQRSERRQDHVWSDDEIAALIDASKYLAHQPESRYDYSPLIRTALFTGLRLGELLGLQWQDIDLHEGVVHVRRQWTRTNEYAPPKTEAALRRIPLSDEMARFLRDFKMRSRHSGDEARPVFASRNGKPLQHRNVTRRGFEPAAEHAGIEGVSFHSMRHAFASRMIHRGISSLVLARLMGHESSAITERRYIHLFDKERTDDAVRVAMGSSRP
jgi:integrase